MALGGLLQIRIAFLPLFRSRKKYVDCPVAGSHFSINTSLSSVIVSLTLFPVSMNNAPFIQDNENDGLATRPIFVNGVSVARSVEICVRRLLLGGIKAKRASSPVCDPSDLGLVPAKQIRVKLLAVAGEVEVENHVLKLGVDGGNPPGEPFS